MVQAPLPLETPKYKLLMKGSATCCSILIVCENCEVEEPNEVVDKFLAMLSTMSDGLCPVLSDEGWDWGDEDSVDEKLLVPAP